MENPATLRPFRTIWLSYKFVLADFGLFLKAASLLTAFWIFFFFPYEKDIPNPLLPDEAYALLKPMITAYFAVAWHRWVLMKERPIALRYGARELKYFLFIFASLLLFDLSSGILGTLSADGSRTAASGALRFLSIAAVAVAWLIAGLAVLIIPFFKAGVSVGHPLKEIWRTWKDFKRNRGRFIVMQIANLGAAFVVFGGSLLLTVNLVRAPLYAFLGRDGEIAWLGGTTISAFYVTEFVVAVFLGIAAALTIAATVTSISLAYATAAGITVPVGGETNRKL